MKNPMLPASANTPAARARATAFRLPPSRTLALATLLGASVALPTTVPTARAASFVWQGGGANSNWSTGANWTGSVAPANDGTADLFFDSSANGNATSVSPAYSVRSLTWGTAANTYLFLGSQLTLGAGGLAQNANNAQILNVQVALSADQTWSLNPGSGALTFNNGAVNNNGHALTINAGGASVINGGFSGTGSLTKTGTGTLTLSGASTYTGDTNITGGTLNLTGSLNGGSGATLGLGSTTASVSSAGTLNLGAGASVSVGTAYIGGYGAGTVNQSGGSFSTNNGDLSVTPAGATSTYNLSGGTLTTGRTLVGDDNANTTGVFNQTGGTHTTGTLALSYSNLGISNGTYNLSGGTLNVGRVIGHDPATTTSGNSVFNFNGGTLQASASRTDFMSALAAANVQAGGAKVDTAGFNVTIAQTLAHDATLGATADGGLTKLGAGTLTLAGNNTYTGSTTFAGGTLNVGSAGALGSAGLLSFGGGTLQFSAANTTDYSARFSTAAGQAFSVDTNGQSVTFASRLSSGGGSLTKLGAGTLVLTANNGYDGATTINAGTLQVGNGGTTGRLGSNSGAIIDNGTLTYNRADNVNLANAISGSGNFVQSGNGTLTLTGANTYAGTTTINAGTLQVGNTGGSGSLGAGDVTNNAALVFNRSNDLTVANAIGGSGSLTKNGAGTLTLTGASTYTGTTNINVGTLAVTTGGSLTGAGNVSLTGDGTTLALSGTGSVSMADGTTFTANGTATKPANVTLAGSASLTTGLAIIGSNGAGSVNQSGGTFTTNGGSLSLGNNAGSSGAYTLTGGTLTVGTFSDTTGTSTFNFNGGTLQAGANGTAFMQGLTTANVQTGGAKIDTNGHDVTIAQPLVHDTTPGASATDGGLTKTGTGTLTLTGASTYAGGTTVSGGTLAVTTGGSLAGGNVTVNGGATLALSGTGRVSPGGGATLTVDGGFNILSGSAPANVTLADSASLSTGFVYVGLAGIGTITQSGGTFTTNGNPLNLGGFINGSSNGTYHLDGGALTVGKVASQGSTSTFNFNGGTLRASGSTGSFLQGLTTANVRNGGAVIDTAGSNVTVAQPLVHSTVGNDAATDGGLTKSGTGMLTLTGASTYTGATTVGAGTLLANNTAGSATGTGAVTVRNGATLGGNGTIAGAVTVQSGATLAPGVLAPSRLTLADSLALQSGSTLAITLGGTTAGGGSNGGYDQVLVGGSLTLAGNLDVRLVNGFTLAVNQTFTILENTGATALTLGTFANAPVTLYTDAAGDLFQVNYAANVDNGLVPNDVTLTYLGANPVPEPSTWALLALGGAGLLGVAWRRRCTVRS